MSLELPSLSVPLGLGALVLVVYLIKDRFDAESNPPGPKPFPILGNALQWPIDEPWKALFDWSKQYGMYLV
jgi:hypothetical protein